MLFVLLVVVAVVASEDADAEEPGLLERWAWKRLRRTEEVEAFINGGTGIAEVEVEVAVGMVGRLSFAGNCLHRFVYKRLLLHFRE